MARLAIDSKEISCSCLEKSHDLVMWIAPLEDLGLVGKKMSQEEEAGKKWLKELSPEWRREYQKMVLKHGKLRPIHESTLSVSIKAKESVEKYETAGCIIDNKAWFEEGKEALDKARERLMNLDPEGFVLAQHAGARLNDAVQDTYGQCKSIENKK